MYTTNPETEDQSLDSESAVIDTARARLDELICALFHGNSSIWPANYSSYLCCSCVLPSYSAPQRNALFIRNDTQQRSWCRVYVSIINNQQPYVTGLTRTRL